MFLIMHNFAYFPFAKHIQNIYNSAERDKQSTCAKIAQVQQEGKRRVTRQVIYALVVSVRQSSNVNDKLN